MYFKNRLKIQNKILLTLKTKKSLYHKIKKVIIINQKYATPQFIAQKKDGDLNSRLKRIKSSLKIM